MCVKRIQKNSSRQHLKAGPLFYSILITFDINPKMCYTFSCFNRLCEYRFTFSWRLWTLLNWSITVPCVCIRECLDPTEMPLRCTTGVFFSLISNSAEPWGLEVGNGTWARGETAPFSSFLSPGSYMPLFSLSTIISSSLVNFLQATVGYSSSQEKGPFVRPKSSVENQFVRGAFCGAEVRRYRPLPLFVGDAFLCVWELGQGSYCLSCFLLYQLPQAASNRFSNKTCFTHCAKSWQSQLIEVPSEKPK